MLDKNRKNYLKEYHKLNREKRNLASKKNYLKNKEGVLAYQKSYRDKNPEEYKKKQREYQKKYRVNNPDVIKATWNRSYKKNKEKIILRAKKAYKQRRLTVLNYYSKGKLECNCCGEKMYKFLAIDHIDNRYGTGKEHRKRSGPALQDWIIKNNFPEGFQILCHNCNVAKGHDGICPHKEI